MKKIKAILLSFVCIMAIAMFASCTSESSSSTAGSSSNSPVETTPITSTQQEGELSIVYEANGGTLSSRILTGLNEGQDVSSKLATPKKTGHDFLYWCTDAELNNKFDGIMTADEMLILYAKYEAKDMTINIYNNTPDKADEVTSNKYGLTLDLDDPTRPNATFIGWYYGNTYIETEKYNPDLSVSSETSVYARFKFNEGTTVYVSKDGKPSAAGTEDDPLDIYTAMYFAGPNVTIELKNETYDLNKRVLLSVLSSGSYNKYVKINGNGATLDFTYQGVGDSNRGIQINGDWYHIINLNVRKAGDNGILIGGSNNIVEKCVTYENADTGIQISRTDSETQPVLKYWPSNNLVLNCTSYNNSDATGENADGFAAKLTCGNNIFDGCMAYCNSDDGYDLYAKATDGPIGTTIIRNCLAFENGVKLDGSGTTNGDGNGFKLGGSNINGHVIVENCAAWKNQTHGFTDNSNPGTIIMKNCTSFDNGAADGKKDNFNIARNSSKANNCYYGLLSFMTNSNTANGDDVRGAISDSIIRITLEADQSANPGTSYYGYTEYYEVNSFYETACGNKIADLDASIFASVTIPTLSADLHTQLRNSDGSFNLGDFLKVVDSNLLTYCDGKQIGANLALTSNEAYAAQAYYYNLPVENVDANDEGSVALAMAYEYLFPSYVENAVYKNFKIPSVGYKVDITWSSSDTCVDVSGQLYKDYAVITRSTEDKNVTLTATLTYTYADGSTKTMTKEFNYVIKALSPNIGTIEGVFDQVVYDGNNITDEGEIIVVKDLNDPSSKELEYGVDYTVSTIYHDSKGNVVDEINSQGKYTAIMTIKLVGYDVSCDVEFAITYLSSGKNSSIESFAGDYIIGGNVTISGTVDCAESTIYAVGLPADADRPNPAQIYSMNIDGQYAAAKYECTSTEYSFDLNVGESVENCKVYIIVVRNDWAQDSNWTPSNISVSNSSRAENTNVSSMQSISTVEDFYKMATTQDETPMAYALTTDLDFTGFTWTVTTAIEASYYFAGYLEGNGHTISNLHIEAPTLPGIFTNIKGGIVKNLYIKNSSVKQLLNQGTRGAAMICGFANGCTIENVHLTNVTCDGYEGVGGIIGTVNSGVNNISKCSIYNDSNHMILFNYRYSGGIIGGILNDDNASQTTITNVSVQTSISSQSGTIAGGIVGRYKNDKKNTELVITNAVYKGVLTAAKYCGGAIGTIDKALTFAYLTNVVVYVEEFGIVHTDNRSLLGSANSDDYSVANNVISIGSYDMGKDNCESNFSIGAVSGNADWWFTIAGFDADVWEVEPNVLIPHIKIL